MGGKAASEGFSYQDRFALYRAVALYEAGSGQRVQVESKVHSNSTDGEAWDVKIENPSGINGEGFTEELWQAKDTQLGKKGFVDYWKRLHGLVHDGKLEFAAKANLRTNVLLGIVTSESISKPVDQFNEFAKCLRHYFHLSELNDLEQVWLEDYRQADLDSMAQQLTNGVVNSLADLDFISRNNGSVFWFRRFTAICLDSERLQDRTLLLINQRLGIQIPDNSSAFADVCGNALELIRSNLGNSLPLEEVVARLAENGAPAPPRRSVVRRILTQQMERCTNERQDSFGNEAELFVEPEAMCFSGRTARDEVKTESAREWIINWLRRDLKNRSGLLILLGDFGHGKSILMRTAAAALARDWRDGDAIPVYVPLRQVVDEPQSFEALVAKAVAEVAVLSDDVWRYHKWIVFCDGFDELNALYQDRPDWIRNRFHQMYRESQSKHVTIVVSSRPILFMDPTLRDKYLSSFERVRLAPFDHPRIQAWLNRAGTDLDAEQLKVKGLLDVVSTPVILSLVATLHRERGISGLNSRREIYSQFFDWVFQTGGSIEPGERLPKHAPIPPDVLQRVAVHLMTHPEARSGFMYAPLLLQELRREFPNGARDCNFDERLFVRHAFREARTDYVEFLHQSLREFLIGEYCFESLFHEVNEREWLFQPRVQRLMFDKAIGVVDVSFFCERVKAVALQQGRSFFDSVNELHAWTEILYNLLCEQQMGNGGQLQTPTLHSYLSMTEDGTIVEKKLQRYLGWCLAQSSMLAFLAQVVSSDVLQISDRNRTSGFNRIMHLIDSLEALNPLRSLLCSGMEGVEFGAGGFQSLDFEGTVLRGNRFSGTLFESCTFQRCDFSKCVFDDQTQFKSCSFLSANMSSSTFTDTTFRNCVFDEGFHGFGGGSNNKFVHCVFNTAKVNMTWRDSMNESTFENCLIY